MNTKTTTKHTPGPWDIHGDKRTLIAPRNGKQMLANTLYDHIVPKYALTLKEAQANARLIAAAPELLDALKTALRVLVTPTGLPDKGKGRTDEQQAALDGVKAAIAKAEGRDA